MRSRYDQNLSSDKRETSLSLPCDNRQRHQWRILLQVEQLFSIPLVQLVDRNPHV